MPLTKEIAESLGLSEEQVNGVDNFMDKTYVPDLKKSWDDTANANAEKILDGAVTYAVGKTGVELQRNQGEKFGDFFNRLTDTALSKAKNDLATKQEELDKKLKEFDGGAELKGQIETLTGEKDLLLKKVAELEKLEGTDVKLAESQKELSDLKLRVAFDSVKPVFPDTVNPYEATAKWNEFRNKVLDKNTIEIDGEGNPVAVSKENKYSQFKLKELVEGDETLSKLLQGREQGGTGGKPADFMDIKGIPFKVKKDASPEEISTQVREHLTKKFNGNALHPDFAKEFQDLYAKITMPEKETA